MYVFVHFILVLSVANTQKPATEPLGLMRHLLKHRNYQTKFNEKKIEIHGGVGVILNDVYYRKLMVDASFSYYLADSISIGGKMVLHLKGTALQRSIYLRRKYFLNPVDSLSPRMGFFMHASLTVFQGKWSLLQESIHYMKSKLHFGVGLIYGEALNYWPAIEMNINFDLFINHWLSVNVALGDMVFAQYNGKRGYETWNIQNYVMLKVGFGVWL